MLMDGPVSAQPSRCPSKQSAAHEQAQPWTATRCHRLLRPLLTHITALRKENARTAVACLGTEPPLPVDSCGSRDYFLGKRPSEESTSECPEKRIRHRYSTKASRKATKRNTLVDEQHDQHDQPVQTQRYRVSTNSSDELGLATPFLRRVRDHRPSSPLQPLDEGSRQTEAIQNNRRCQHPRRCRKGRCVFESEVAALRTSIDPQRHALYESIFRALDSLLRATSPSKNEAAAPKSLLAMCLRKVPDYVAELEWWERKDAEEGGTRSALKDSQISFEVYSELESLGAAEGWRHLCIVVRSHGVRVIQEAVSEGLVDIDVADLLLSLCREYMPPRECESLLDSIISRQYRSPSGPDEPLFESRALRPLRALKTYDTSGCAMMTRKLSELLSNRLLPAEWILTGDFSAVWAWAIRSIADSRPCEDAVGFLMEVMEALCDLISVKRPRMRGVTGMSRDKAPKTLTAVVAALAGMVLLAEEGFSQHTERQSTTKIERLRNRVEYIVRTCSAKLRNRKDRGGQLGTYMLGLCAFLCLGTNSAAESVQAAWWTLRECRGTDSWWRQHDATMIFTSSVAHCCSRGSSLSPNAYLTQLCDKLEALDLPGHPLNNIRVDAAFCLADLTGDLRDLSFAESLRTERIAGDSAPAHSPGKRTAFAGFRWDEGISEWVTASPPNPVSRRTTRSIAMARSSAATTPFVTSRVLRSSAQKPAHSADKTTEDDNVGVGTGVVDDESSQTSWDDGHGLHLLVKDSRCGAVKVMGGSMCQQRRTRLSSSKALAEDIDDDELSLHDDQSLDKENRETAARSPKSNPCVPVSNRKRMKTGRASLVSLQPLRQRIMNNCHARADELSDDELSFC